MKHTSLFCAVALAAAMSTQAFALDTTNAVGSVQGFNVATTPLRVYNNSDSALSGWVAQSDDQSEVIAAPLSENDTVAGSAFKHLKLATEGQELVYGLNDTTITNAIIEMKVKLVGSDSEPTITNADVHAAVFLKTESADPTDDGLYAFTTGGVWSKLGTLNGLTNGSMVALRVVMDYSRQKVTYEAALLGDDAEAYAYPNEGLVLESNGTELVYTVLGANLDMANGTNAQSEQYLHSVSFKGTGGVDDFFIKKVTTTPSVATIKYELWDNDYSSLIDADSSTTTLDTMREDSVSQFTPAYWDNMVEDGLVLLSAELFDITQAGTTNGLDWANGPTFDSNGNMNITTNNYLFVAENTYLVKVTVGTPVQTYTVTFDKNDNAAQGTMDAQTFTNGVVQNLKANTFTLEGYTFAGWATSSAGEVVYADGASVTLSGANLTLYAKWTENAQPAAGVEFGTFVIDPNGLVEPEFTEFSVSGNTATAKFKASFTSTGTATQKTFYAQYVKSLGDIGNDERTYTVEATATEPVEGVITVTFTLPAGDAAFFVGFTNDANAEPAN